MNQEQRLDIQTNEQTQAVGKQTKISSVFNLLSKSFEIYKSIFWKLILMLLIPALAGLAIGIIIGLLFGLSLLIKSAIISTILKVAIGLVSICAVTSLIIISVIAQTGLYLLIGKANENPSVKETFLKAKKFAWKFFTVKITVGVFTLLWALLFFIPGLIMALFYSLSIWAFFHEGFTGGQALKRSKELIKNYWWAVFGRFAGIFVIFMVAAIIPPIFINSHAFANLWGTLIQIILFFLTPFLIIYSQLIFKDLKNIKGESKITKKEGGSIGIVIAFLFIIVAVIKLLSTLAVISPSTARIKARDASVIASAKQIQTGAELYNSINGYYPNKINDLLEADILSSSINFEDKIEYTKTENGAEVCFTLESGYGKFKEGRSCLSN